MNKYLEEFSILAGSLNIAPNNLEKERYNLFVDHFNQIMEYYLKDEIVLYYRELLNHVGIMEYMIDIIQKPKKHWKDSYIVYEDYKKIQANLSKLISLERRIQQEFTTPILIESVSIEACFVTHPYPIFYKLVAKYLQAYSNLVIAFYNKIKERAKELLTLENIDDILSYEPKESFVLFFDIYNYLIKRVKDIRNFNQSYNDINTLILNINMMEIIAGILNNESDLTNYEKYQELCEENQNIKYDEPYIRDWIYALENQYRESIVR